jgi:hypothetical protein
MSRMNDHGIALLSTRVFPTLVTLPSTELDLDVVELRVRFRVTVVLPFDGVFFSLFFRLMFAVPAADPLLVTVLF